MALRRPLGARARAAADAGANTWGIPAVPAGGAGGVAPARAGGRAARPAPPTGGVACLVLRSRQPCRNRTPSRNAARAQVYAEQEAADRRRYTDECDDRGLDAHPPKDPHARPKAARGRGRAGPDGPDGGGRGKVVGPRGGGLVGWAGLAKC